MIVAIQRDEFKDGPSAPRWAELLAAAGHTVRWVNVYHADILSQLEGCAGFLWRFGQKHGQANVARRLLPVLERELNLLVYPDQNSCWYFDDKIALAHLFSALRIPTPRTWVWFDRAAAGEWARRADYPLVLKLWEGAGSENVRLVRTAAEAQRWIDLLFGHGTYLLADRWVRPLGLRHRLAALARLLLQGRGPAPPADRWELHKNYALFQEYVPDNDFDTRVTVIGRRAFAYRRFNRPDDFRASGSGRGEWDPASIAADAVRVAFRAARRLRSSSAAFDILRHHGRPMIVEVCYTYVSWLIHNCPGHWELHGEPETGALEWVPGAMWPEEAQIADFVATLAQRRTARAAQPVLA